MTTVKHLSHQEVDELAEATANDIAETFPDADTIMAYAVPRGGVPAAYLIMQHTHGIKITENPEGADFFIDDLIDSGHTRDRFMKEYPGRPFFTLLDKNSESRFRGKWIVFPWDESTEGSIEDATMRLLQFIGEDPTREGLRETPARVARAWAEWTSGYSQDPAECIKAFQDGGESIDEMIMVRDIPFYSHCEHHMAPFFGNAHIAYIPNGRILGLSKMARVLDIFAKRLQVQERLTDQVVDALMKGLHAKGVAVCIEARHFCMESRGVRKHDATTVTTALRGVFRTDPAARAEFLSSVR